MNRWKKKAWNHRPKSCSYLACRNLPSFPWGTGSQWAPEPTPIFRTCSRPLPGSTQVPSEQSTQHQDQLANLCDSDEQSLLWISTSFHQKYQEGPLRGSERTLLRSETTSSDLALCLWKFSPEDRKVTAYQTWVSAAYTYTLCVWQHTTDRNDISIITGYS